MTRERSEKMTEEKKNTMEQLCDAERAAKVLTSSPKRERNIVAMMTNSFIAGMEAQRNLEKTAV